MDTTFQTAQLTAQATIPAAGATPGAAGGAGTTGIDADRAERFQSLFQDATRPAQAPAAAQAADQTSRENAIRSLELDGTATATTSTTGDTILGGLSKLREVFDVQQARLQDMARSSVDPTNMVAVQLEVVQYGMLVDVTSKLTGKATQSFDTLMKGQ